MTDNIAPSPAPSSSNQAARFLLFLIAGLLLIWAMYMLERKINRLQRDAVRTMRLDGHDGVFFPSEDGGLWVPMAPPPGNRQ